jgi:hypothetical protein
MDTAAASDGSSTFPTVTSRPEASYSSGPPSSRNPPLDPDIGLVHCTAPLGEIQRPLETPAVKSAEQGIYQWFRGCMTHPLSSAHPQHPYPLREWPGFG